MILTNKSLRSLLRISVHPDSETGGIRTANRKYPDTLSAKLINIKCDSSNRC